MTRGSRSAASFRDPGGFVFHRGAELYRQVNRASRGDYDMLMGSGLYRELSVARLLVPHEEVDADPWLSETAYRVVRPERVPFVSYPYEWCFSQLLDAAILTLEIQARSVASGMALKDATAYNVQFVGGRPIFIDTLSFEAYREGEPWAAYRQFCQHFLAPLALMSLVDVRLGQLSRSNIDGVPLDLAARLLPGRSRVSFGLLVHVHLHARLQASRADARVDRPARGFSRGSMLGLIDSLLATIRGLRPPRSGPALGWAEYEAENNYSEAARGVKRRLVAEFLGRIDPAVVWDLGANAGEYSRLAASRGAMAVAFDLDPACVERNYRRVVESGEARVLPLLADLTNPSPATGWHNRERMSLAERGPADAVLALAMVHHLAIAGNVPLGHVADFFADLGPQLVVEFVPKDDPQCLRLLRGRRDVFDVYSREGFESAFGERFAIERSEAVGDSGRILYLMQRRGRP